MTTPFEILLASDFTARCDRPLDRASRIQRERGGKLVIVHVLEKREMDESLVECLRADLPEEAKDAEIVVRAGSAPTVLAEIAMERGSDLIVTGVARYNGIGDFLLGTAVDHIVRNAAAPVLVVRRRATFPYDRIVVASDLSDCSRTALVAAARIFPGAAITLIHAFHVPYEGWLRSDAVKEDVRTEAESSLKSFLDHPDLEFARPHIEARAEEGETSSVVLSQLDRAGSGLLVLGTHGRSGFAAATIGSQAEALMAAARCDVLMVRERQA